MKTTLKSVLTLMVILTMILTAAGCGGNLGNVNAPTTAQVTQAGTAGQTESDIPDYLNKEGFPIVKSPITLSMAMTEKAGYDNHENKFLIRMEQLTGIKWEYEFIPSSAVTERRNLMFNSGTYPDVFFKMSLTTDDELNYGAQGILIPLQDLIAKYGPNLKAAFEKMPVVRKTFTTPDGNIYAIGNLSDTNPGGISHFYYNITWMNKLGIKEPETHEEYYNMLKAFRENDPNGNGLKDEIPLTLVGVGEVKKFFYNWGLAFDYKTGMGLDDNGNPMYVYNTNEFKNFLEYMAKLYKEELLDNETFTQTGNQRNAKGNAEEMIVGGFNAAGAFTRVPHSRHYDYQTLLPLKGLNGKRVWPKNYGASRGAFAITDNCKYPEAALRWVDYMWSEEGSILSWAGVEGEDWKYIDDKGTWDWILAEGQTVTDLRNTNTIQGGPATPCPKPEAFWNRINEPYEASLAAIRGRLDPYAVDYFPNLYLMPEAQKRKNSLSADIDAYVDQFIARTISGEISVEAEWSNYISTLDSMGLKEYMKIYSDAYEQYLTLN